MLSRVSLIAGILSAVLFLTVSMVSPDTPNTEQEFTLPVINQKLEVSVRVLVWENTITGFLGNPWVGRGTGMDVADVHYFALSGDEQTLHDAHNIWLSVLGQTGLLGLGAFVLLVIFVVKKCRFRVDGDDENEYALAALSCAFVGAFFFQGLVGSFEDARHLWILIGLILAISQASNDKDIDTRFSKSIKNS